jgi:hypothetical protein
VNTEAKTDTVTAVSVNLNKDKKIAFMNLKVTGTPDGNFEGGLFNMASNRKRRDHLSKYSERQSGRCIKYRSSIP